MRLQSCTPLELIRCDRLLLFRLMWCVERAVLGTDYVDSAPMGWLLPGEVAVVLEQRRVACATRLAGRQRWQTRVRCDRGGWASVARSVMLLYDRSIGPPDTALSVHLFWWFPLAQSPRMQR